MDKAGTHLMASAVPPEASARDVRMGGRIKEILLAFAVMTIPMLAFSGVLLGLVYSFRVTRNPFVSNNLAFDSEQDDSKAYFVEISATTLITVASWSSTVAPVLVGFAITLISYPVARGILAASEAQNASQLPTPYQLSLLLRILSSGSASGLWHWLKYTVGWNGKRESQGRSLKILSSILSLGLLLSALVLASDTWLHFATKTINFSQVETNPDASDLSFGVHENCTNVNQTYYFGCNLNNPASGAVLLGNDPVGVLSNISTNMLVQTHTSGPDQYAYVGSAQVSRLASIDYTVKSYAVSSQCKPVTTECMSQDDVFGIGVDFNCPFAFQGLADTSVGAANSLQMTYFTDSSGSSNNTNLVSMANPYYYAAVAVVNMRNPRPAALANDPQIISGEHGGSTIIALYCKSTVYDLEYTSVNGTITRFITTPSNASLTNIIQGTQRLTQVGDANLVQAASVAGLGDSAQAIADQFALSYSQTALAAASGAFQLNDALESQVRKSILVARIPKAPLFSLIGANVLLAVLGVLLTFMAVAAFHGDVGEVQARLSIPALVASQFEEVRSRSPVHEVEEMFEERHGQRGPRIGFVKVGEGAWTFDSWRPY